MLTSAVEDGKASIMMLAKNSKILSQEIAELESLIKDATQARSAESARNQAMIEDAKNAHAAVLAASEILKNFYKKSAVMALDQFGSPRPRVGLVTLAHGVPIPMGTMSGKHWQIQTLEMGHVPKVKRLERSSQATKMKQMA